MRTGTDARVNCFCLTALAFAAAVSFASSLQCGFVWVDQAEILEAGYRITSTADLRQVWVTSLDEFLFRHDQVASPDTSRGGYWRPLYALGITFDWWVHGDRAWRWHAGNIVWHVAVLWALFFIGLQLASRGVSFFATLLFAVHPLGVHSVSWVSGRKDLQCAFFAAFAIWSFVRLLKRPKAGWLEVVGCSFATLLAIGFKELGLCVPLFLVTIIAIHRFTRQPWSMETEAVREPHDSSLRLAALQVALAIQWAIFMGVFAYRRLVLGASGLGAEYPTDSFADNVANAIALAWHFVGRVFWPWQPQISDRWEIVTLSDLAAWLAIGATVIALAAFALALRYVRTLRQPANVAWLSALAWYVIWMSPASGILPLRHVRAERYLYPASWGLLLFACTIGNAVVRRRSEFARKALRGVALLVAIGWMLHTSLECRHWQDDETLFSMAVKRDSRYREGHVALAEVALREKDYIACAKHSEAVFQLAEDQAESGYWSPFIARNNYGLALYHLGEFEPAKRQFQASLELRPKSAAAMYHLGLVAVARRDLEAANRWLEQSVAANPSDFLAASNLAYVRLQRGDVAGCKSLLEPIVDTHPDNELNLRNLASCHMALKEYQPAAQRFRQLVELSNRAVPDQFKALDFAKLAWCETKNAEYDLAREHVQMAEDLDGGAGGGAGGGGDSVVKQIVEAVRRELENL